MHRHNLAFDNAPTRRSFDENGFLRVTACHVTKETVNPYYGREIPGWQELGLDPERIYYGFRSGEEIERAAKTFEGLPVLMGHHVESAEDPQKEYRVGSTGTDAAWHAPYLDLTIFVTDADAIRDIEDGKAREISCAYLYEPDFTSGDYGGRAYDFVMRDIRGNHVALVEEGRAGSDVVVADEQIKPNDKRCVMNLFRKPRVAMDELPDIPEDPKAPEEEKELAKDNDKLKAMFAALKEAGKISEEEFAALCSAAFDEDIVEEEEAVTEDEEAKNVRDAIDEAVEKIQSYRKEGEEEQPEDEEYKAGLKAAADACGMDAESPEFQKAFAEGVKYGEGKEKAEPEKLDREHESEGMEKAMDEEEVKAAMDAAIKLAAKQAHDNSVAKFRALSAAADACRPVLGNIDALAFDSAESIYGAALKKAGIDIRKHPKAAWRSMFEVFAKGQSEAVHMAQDSSIGKKYEGAFSGLNNIRKG